MRKKVYAVLVTSKASVSKVSSEGYSSLAKAQAFIESRAGNPQKISHWRYRDDDWTEYLICEVRVDLGEE
ncbi:hypothetical protein [Acutalibacter muris]|uniref:hypothetical protein n=1 Tax=Acutalibacter muris TaxID=1796620 RepID=UPI00272A6C1C|nr:hypothetical protein [Acutalibacter muris]